jgi:hypothetical protein
MLSTAQALQGWDRVLSVLADVKAGAAAHPGQPMPVNLSQRVLDSMHAVSGELASPVATWMHMLKQEVSTIGPATSCETLTASHYLEPHQANCWRTIVDGALQGRHHR